MDDKIRVLHVIGKRPKGGIGTFLQNVTKYINKDEFQFDFLINGSPIPREFDERMNELGSNVYVLPELSYRSTFHYLKSLNDFYKKRNKYKIVHIHSPNIAIFNYIFVRIYSSAKIAIHSHSTKFSDKTINSIRNFILHLPIRVIADIKFACNHASSVFMYGKKATNNGSVNIVKNGIETERYAFNNRVREAMRLELNAGDSFLIGHVGAFVPVKNHDFLIEMFVEVLKLEPKAVLVLVGDGELHDSIHNKVKKLGINDSVRLLGRRQDVDKIMQALDAFVLPSKFEGMPLVGIEAQASGLPCFFSGSISKELDITEEVYFIDLGAYPIIWSKKIIEYAKINQSNKKREKAFREVIDKQYDITGTVKSIESVYKSL